MIRRPPRSTQSRSSAASDVYKRQLAPAEGADQSGDGDSERAARHHRRHGPAARAFLRHERASLAEPPEPLRVADSGGKSRNHYQETADFEAPGPRTRTVSYTHLRAHETRHELV